MPNLKFSQFQEQTDSANVQFVVGYNGTNNVRIAPANIGGNPAGSNTQLQYNNGGAFGAIPGFLYDDTTDRLIIDTTRVVFGDASGASFQNGLTIWDDVEFRGTKFELADGSAAAPILTFFNTGDNNTGMFRPGSDIIAFATGGQEEFRIGANGEIGLSGANFGTSGQVLTSNGTGTGASWTTIGGGGASSLNGLSDCVADATNNFIGNVPASASGAIQNTSLGINALNPITSGDFNVGIGYNAGSAVTTGQKNTAIGRAALANVSTNSGSTAVGYQAGFISTAGDSVYIGNEPGRANTSTGHISIGYEAGYSNTSGIRNTNLGYQAGYSNSTGGDNVSIGYQAAKQLTGSNSISIGYLANSANTSSGDNTVIGWLAMQNGTGTSNVAIGTGSLRGTGFKNFNTALGAAAGSSALAGSNNLLLGYNAQASSGSVSNEITLGDANITALRCQIQTIAALSDSRDKKNIQPSTYGLDFINKLNPVTFDWNMRDGAKVGDKDLGFIAQELQEVDDENLQLVYANNPDRLEASYGRLIPVLVQAIKELKAEVELLKS